MHSTLTATIVQDVGEHRLAIRTFCSSAWVLGALEYDRRGHRPSEDRTPVPDELQTTCGMNIVDFVSDTY